MEAYSACFTSDFPDGRLQRFLFELLQVTMDDMESTMKSTITRIENSWTLGTWTVDAWKRGRAKKTFKKKLEMD